MVKKSYLVIIIVLLLVVGLAACERSLAPTSNAKTTPTAKAGTKPKSTGDVMIQLEQFVTQTAMAAQAKNAQKTPAAPAAGQATPAAPNAALATKPAQPAAILPALPDSNIPSPTPTRPPVVVPTATPGLPASYTLQQGEYPFCIARRFNIDPTELLNLNGLGPSSMVYGGTVLRIPQTGKPFPSTNRALRAHPTTHMVGSGESIYSVACLYGDVDPNSIAFANNLTEPYKLTVGQTIQIP